MSRVTACSSSTETGVVAPTNHRPIVGDSRNLESIVDEPVHLVVTSPPYWNLKEYPDRVGQLGNMADYEAFVDEIARVCRQCYHVLVPGGRMVLVVGDVCLSRRRHGRHRVMPLTANN